MREKGEEEDKCNSRTCDDASSFLSIEAPREEDEGQEEGSGERQEKIPPERMGLGGWVKAKKMASVSEYNYTVEIVTITADSSDGSVNLKPLYFMLSI